MAGGLLASESGRNHAAISTGVGNRRVTSGMALICNRALQSRAFGNVANAAREEPRGAFSDYDSLP